MYFFKSQAMECGHYILAVAIFGKSLKSSVTTSEWNKFWRSQCGRPFRSIWL